jgi:hypothetical protein
MPGPIHKHSTLSELQPFIPDIDRITVFAINRATDEIIESDYRLHQIAMTHGESNPDWSKSVALSQHETFDEFKMRRWDTWLQGETAWDHWTGGYPVTRFEFDALDWNDVLKLCGVEGPVHRISP